jgi:hypothetical protein
LIRYEIDPFQRDGRLQSDPEARENFSMAHTRRLILREKRNFVEAVDGTWGLSSTLWDPA